MEFEIKSFIIFALAIVINLSFFAYTDIKLLPKKPFWNSTKIAGIVNIILLAMVGIIYI